MLSKKERKERTEIRKELIEQGILLKPKPKTNYMQYLKKAESMLMDLRIGNGCDKIISAVMFFYPQTALKQKTHKFSEEEKVAIKIIHFAYENMLFEKKLKAEGRERYSIAEFYKEVYCKVFPEAEYNNRGEEKV